MKLFIAVILLFISTAAMAAKSPTSPDYSMAAVELGFKSGTATVTGSDTDKQDSGYQLGVSGVYNITEAFGIKSGLFYTTRPISSDILTTHFKGSITYFEVPVFAMLKFEDYAGVYAGPSLAIHLSDEASAGTITGAKSMVIPITVGAQFKFLPNFGADLFFESVTGDVATGIKDMRSVGINLMFTID